jgi:hypothetical protein
MDTCHYCNFQYHPMPVYRLSNDREKWRVTTPYQINVCHLRLTRDADGELDFDRDWRECADKAESDGYGVQWDLTPTR